MRRKSSYLVVVISAALFSSNTYSALADATPSPSPTFDSFKAAQEQYKKDRDAFVAALRDREMKMRIINTTFKSAVDKATTDAKTAMALASTPDQKNSINSTRRAAVAAAIVARESAIAALDPIPTPPIEPVKPPKAAPFGMSDQKGKQKR
ncbi:hypothetical protein DLE03_03040 [Actinobacteria bacterium IMCC25003]|nr:hypothetical protein DLE03_03040 [Actinobacteria bacterium IMCC25003]